MVGGKFLCLPAFRAGQGLILGFSTTAHRAYRRKITQNSNETRISSVSK